MKESDKIKEEIKHIEYCIDMLTKKKAELEKGIYQSDAKDDLSELMASDAVKYAEEHQMSIRSLMRDMYKAGARGCINETSFGILTWMIRVCTGLTQRELCTKVLSMEEMDYLTLAKAEDVPRDVSMFCLGNALGMTPNTLNEYIKKRYPYEMVLECLDNAINTIIKNNKWIVNRIPIKIFEEIAEGLS